MPVLTFPPLKSPTRKPLKYPFTQPFALDPSCVLCLLPIRDDKWYDFSGHGNHGTFVGPTWTAKGRLGPAPYFDGPDDYVDCGSDDSLDITTELTMEAWVNPETLAQNTVIFCQAVPALPGKMCIGIYNTSDELLLGHVGNKTGLKDISAYLTAGKFQHWVLTYDITNNTIKFYLDGEEQTLTTVTTYWTPVGAILRIGSKSAATHFKGLIDEVRIYNRLLSASEVKALYEQGVAIIAG